MMDIGGFTLISIYLSINNCNSVPFLHHAMMADYDSRYEPPQDHSRLMVLKEHTIHVDE